MYKFIMFVFILVLSNGMSTVFKSKPFKQEVLCWMVVEMLT